MFKKFKNIFLVPIVLVSIFSIWLFGYLYTHSKPILKSGDIDISYKDTKVDYNSNLTNNEQGFFYDLIFNTYDSNVWYQRFFVNYTYNNFDYDIIITESFYNGNYIDVFGSNFSIIDNEKIGNYIINYVFDNYNYTITINDINTCDYVMYLSNFSVGNTNLYQYCYNINLPVYVYANTTNAIASFGAEFIRTEWLSSGSSREEVNIIGGSFSDSDTNYILNGGLYYKFRFDNVLNNSIGGTNFNFNFSYYDSYEYTLIINNLNATIQDLQAQLRSLNVVNQNQLFQITDLQNQISSLNEMIIDLQNEIDSINDDYSLVIDEKDSTINYLYSQIDSLNAEITILRRQVELENAEFSFTRLFWTIGSLPLESFKTFFNVSFLGINISDIFLGIIFLGLIIFLFRKFFGMFFNL